MTFIFGQSRDDFLILASDRRLTRQVSPTRWEIADDDSTKGVLCVPLMTVFAYTGLAQLPPAINQRLADMAETPTDPGKIELLPTYEWLAYAVNDRMSRAGEEDFFEGLAEDAARSLDRVRATYGFDGALAVYAGNFWAGPRGDQRHEPLLVQLSNVHGSDGVPTSPTRTFSCRGRSIRETDFNTIFSKPVEDWVNDKWAAVLERLIARKADPRAFANVAVGLIRDVATYDGSVGPDILVTCMPRLAAEHALIDNGSTEVLAKPPNLETVTFSVVREMSRTFWQRAPATVLGQDCVILEPNFSGPGTPMRFTPGDGPSKLTIMGEDMPTAGRPVVIRPPDA